jgi:hypothetical protein
LKGLKSLLFEEIRKLRKVYHFWEDVSECLELGVIYPGQVLENNVDTFVVLLSECYVERRHSYFLPGFFIKIDVVVLKLFKEPLVDHFEIFEDIFEFIWSV